MNRYCKHCNSRIVLYSATGEPPGYWVHANGLFRCDTDKTNKPYGLEATPVESRKVPKVSTTATRPYRPHPPAPKQPEQR